MVGKTLRVRSFNGAAVLGLRRRNTIGSSLAIRTALQWSRSLRTAETSGPDRCIIDKENASMEPQS